eukprot:1675982-Rhodomonas_salina.1
MSCVLPQKGASSKGKGHSWRQDHILDKDPLLGQRIAEALGGETSVPICVLILCSFLTLSLPPSRSVTLGASLPSLLAATSAQYSPHSQLSPFSAPPPPLARRAFTPDPWTGLQRPLSPPEALAGPPWSGGVAVAVAHLPARSLLRPW